MGQPTGPWPRLQTSNIIADKAGENVLDLEVWGKPAAMLVTTLDYRYIKSPGGQVLGQNGNVNISLPLR